MRSGKLDRPILIQQATYRQDAAGQEIESWNTWLDCYANWMPVMANEQQNAQGIHTNERALVTIRYKSGIAGTMRIVYEGKNYKIVGYTEFRREGRIEIGVEAWR